MRTDNADTARVDADSARLGEKRAPNPGTKNSHTFCTGQNHRSTLSQHEAHFEASNRIEDNSHTACGTQSAGIDPITRPEQPIKPQGIGPWETTLPHDAHTPTLPPADRHRTQMASGTRSKGGIDGTRTTKIGFHCITGWKQGGKYAGINGSKYYTIDNMAGWAGAQMEKWGRIDDAAARGNEWMHQHLDDDLEFDVHAGAMHNEILHLISSPTSKIVGLEPQVNQMLDAITVRPLYANSLPSTIPNSQEMACYRCTPPPSPSTSQQQQPRGLSRCPTPDLFWEVRESRVASVFSEDSEGENSVSSNQTTRWRTLVGQVPSCTSRRSASASSAVTTGLS